MKILLDLRAVSGEGYSGIKEYACSLYRELLTQDKDNSYILFQNSFSPERILEDFLHQAEIVKGGMPNRLYSLGVKAFGLPKLDRKIQADIFFSPHFNASSMRNWRKRVLTIHDLSFVHFSHFFSFRQNFWHWLQNISRQIRKSGRIIAVSDFTKEDIVRIFNVSPENVVRVYSGINPLYSSITDKEILGKFRKDKFLERPFILFLGTIEPRKNISGLIRAFNLVKSDKQFKDFLLVLAGGKGWLFHEIEKEAQRSSFAEDIRLVGPVSPEEALLLYNSAELFVYPSFFEGFGFPPLEAQACGLPVISSNRASLPEILRDSALLIDPWKTEELAEAIEGTLDSFSIRDRLIRKGLANAGTFSWGKAARETLKIFEDVFNEESSQKKHI